MKPINTFYFLFLPLLAASLLLLSGCSAADSEPVSKTGLHFDTIITVSIYGMDQASSEQILDGCFELADHYENLLSKTIDGSDIWNLNHADGQAVTVDPDTAYLLKKAVSYAELSDGAVDPTIGPLSDLWNFSSDHTNHTVPSASDIASKLSHVDYHCISIDGNSVSLSDPDAEIDLGFIAKGYIADQMKAYLISKNVSSALINLGGNVLTIGSKPDGSNFTIGIQRPFADTNTSITTVSVKNQSVVSSGNYERYFKVGDTIYHHILDTNTGYPIQNGLYGVTIINQSSTDGDALSTTCFALGLEKGMALIESLKDTEAIFITSDEQLHKSSGLQ